MADVLLLSLTKFVIEKLANSFIFQPTLTYTIEQANNAISVEYELKNIQNNMETVYDVLADAEKKQLINNSIRMWLRDLKCIFYDVDDLIDEASTDCLRHNVENGDFSFNARYPFRSFHLSLAIQEIGAKLECVVARKDEFGLIQAQDKPANQKIWDHCNKIRAYFNDHDPIIIGRNAAKHEIMSEVLSMTNANSLSVLPIVAKGGIGKTTLAKLVYSDIRNFDIKLWACVSQKFYKNNILTKILQSNNDVHFECLNQSFEELVKKTDELLNGKKYFLVLDDMMLEDKLEWKKLEKCLAIGKEGSMILITTRNVKVASITKTMEPYKLGGLLEDECWSIFRELAFEGYVEETRYLNLQKIGKTIVSKCWGVPLVVKVLASMLRFERDVHVWQRIRDTDLNNNDEYDIYKVMKLMKLSYDNLRPQVKQCFAYLSFYSNDYVYDSSEVLDIGIALGLFKQENGIIESEEVARSFLKELALNSLLSIEEQQIGNRSSIEAFKLHDIMHDLATDIMEDERVDIATPKRMPIVPNHTRHVMWGHESTFDGLAPKELPIELGKAIKARTFRLFEVNSISLTMLDEIISKFVYLRVLDLSGALLEELPNSIGKLKHLRYLNLTKNVLIQRLPSTICNLVNLDTFHTKGCVRLKELPMDLHLLLRLRKFSVTTMQESLINTKVNELISVQHLEIHSCPRLVSLWGSSGSTEGLTSLRSLNISGCPKMKRLPDCIKLLVNLEQLTLHNCEELDLEEEHEGLQGLQNLKELFISLLPKFVWLPHAIIQSSKATLETLELNDCKGLIHFVDPLRDCFGEFESLGQIVVKRCPGLLAFPNSICRLDTLEDIVILESPQLAKSCSLTPESKALDFTLIHHVLNIQIDGAILTKQRNQPNQNIRDPLRTSIMTFWSNAVDMTPKKQHSD